MTDINKILKEFELLKFNKVKAFEVKDKEEIKRDIINNLGEIRRRSLDALYCLKSDDLTFVDKNKIMERFSSVPEACEALELLIYNLVMNVELEAMANDK